MNEHIHPIMKEALRGFTPNLNNGKEAISWHEDGCQPEGLEITVSGNFNDQGLCEFEDAEIRIEGDIMGWLDTTTSGCDIRDNLIYKAEEIRRKG